MKTSLIAALALATASPLMAISQAGLGLGTLTPAVNEELNVKIHRPGASYGPGNTRSNGAQGLAQLGVNIKVWIDGIDNTDQSQVLGALVVRAGLRVQELDFGHVEHAGFDLVDQPVPLRGRHVAAGANIDHAEELLDFREVLDALAENEKRSVDGKEQC